MSRRKINIGYGLENYRLAGGAVIDDFSDAASWLNFSSTGTASVEEDTTNVRYGSSSLKFIQTATGTVKRYKYFGASGLDLSGYDTFQLVVYAHEHKIANHNIQIYLSTGAQAAMTNRNDVTLGTSLTGTLKKGWNVLAFHKEDIPVIGGGVTWSNVNNIVFDFKSTTSAASMTFDALLGGYQSRPKVVLTMDDGFFSQKAAAEEANALGMKMSLGVIPSLIGSSASFLSTANIDALYDAGNDVMLHHEDSYVAAADHGASYIDEAQAVLDANGWTRARDHIAWPLGEFNDNTIAVAQARGIKSARSVRGAAYAAGPPEKWESVSTVGWEPTGAGIANKYSINALGLDSSLTIAQAKAEIDQAVRIGATLFFYGHGIAASAGALQWASADWTELLGYLSGLQAQRYLDVVTVSDWYNGLAG